jgi:NarL family two-component system response regulator LiaR
MVEPIRVALVDDHHVVRRGLRSFLESFADLVVVGEAANGEEALAQLEQWRAAVVVMDVRMPGGIDGIEATRHLRLRAPATQVVVLTALTDEARISAALRVGALGFVPKEAPPELLLAAIRSAARGQSALEPALARAVLQDLIHSSGAAPALTPRETTVLRLIAHGHTNRAIADQLTVSEETVKTHVGNILTKLHLAHRTQAALYALKQGLVSLDELEL